MSSSTDAINQFRRTILNGREYVSEALAGDIYQSVSVTQDGDGFSAEVSLWNIARPKWSAVEQGDRFAVELGYWPYPQSPVISGVVDEKDSPEKSDSDTKYVFRGTDKTEKAIKNGRWKGGNTWVEPTIERVIRDIAARAGVAIGTINAPGNVIQRCYPIQDDKPFSFWLDDLVEHANSFGDEEYEWTTETPQLNFIPKSEEVGTALQLRDGGGGNILRLDPSEGTDDKTGGSDNMDFEALLDPRIRKDALVQVSAETYPGTYRVQEYTLTSSTDDGSHEMSGTLAPTDAEYEATERGKTARSLSTTQGVR